MTSPVPNIPGEFVKDTFDLKKTVASLLGLNSYKLISPLVFLS
jgi:hypothetical protein